MYDLGEGPWSDAYWDALPKDAFPQETRRRAGYVGANHLILNVAKKYEEYTTWTQHGDVMLLLVDKSDISKCKVLGCNVDNGDAKGSHWGLACWRLLGSDYLLLVIGDQGFIRKRITRVADFLEWPSELCAGGSNAIIQKLISEGRLKEFQNITVDVNSTPDFVDLGDKRFLGEGVLMTRDRNYAFCKPDGWTGNLDEITIKELKGNVPPMPHSGYANSSLDYTDFWSLSPTSCISVVHLGPGDVLEVKEEPRFQDVTYMCRLKHRGGGYYTVLSGRHVADSVNKMWAYDYINGTVAPLDVPTGTWVATCEKTMKRLKGRDCENLDGSEMMDVNDFPEFKAIEEWFPYKNYKSSCTDENILKTIFRRYESGSHRGNDWEVNLKNIGRFRVIAGMGPVPSMVRSKNYKDIKMEDFADYLGGPVFYNECKDYPILVHTSYIDAFTYRSGSAVGEIELSNIGVSMQSLVWVGVVDIEMEEEPLKYHSIQEACVAPPKTDDGRPYFEVKSGRLTASVSIIAEGPTVGNVAIGRWFYKIAQSGQGKSQLIAWHESVDNEPEFQAPRDMFTRVEYRYMNSRSSGSEDSSWGSISYPEYLSYDEKKVLRDRCMDLVDPVLEYGNVPMDLRECIGDYLVEHQDSPYWIDGFLDDGWMLHHIEMTTPVVGFFYPEDWGVPFRTDMLIHDGYNGEYKWPDPWQINIDNIPRGSVRGMPGGCLYTHGEWGPHTVDFKFKNPDVQSSEGQVPVPPKGRVMRRPWARVPSDLGQIHAVRIIVNQLQD